MTKTVLAARGRTDALSRRVVRRVRETPGCSALDSATLRCLSQAAAASPNTCVGTSSRCPTCQSTCAETSLCIARSELSLGPAERAECGANMALCRPQRCIGLTVVNLTRPASCAATALPSCFPPSGNRAASSWRLRSSSADASEDAFLVAPAPELVCLCSSSLKWRGRACGLGTETSASARGVLWTYGVLTECGHCMMPPL